MQVPTVVTISFVDDFADTFVHLDNSVQRFIPLDAHTPFHSLPW